MPDIPGSDLVKKINESKGKLTPVIVYSAKDFNKAEMNQLNGVSNSVLVKGVNTLEELLEQTILQLHINPRELAKENRALYRASVKNRIFYPKKHIGSR
jgi:DNA-binding response OmpR family regulator